MDDSTSFDTLLERLIEEAKADPAARDKLLRALLPLELLRLPEEVVDMKRLLEQTVQTQAGILKTQEMLIEAVNRLESRQDEILAEQARMRETQEKLIAAVDGLLAAVDRLNRRQEEFAAEQAEMKKEMKRIADDQADMRKTLDAVVANQVEMQATQKRMQDDIGQLKGESLEVRLDFRLVPKLRQHFKIRKTKVIRSVARPSNGNFFDEIDDALDENIITERQRGRVFDTDMIMKGVVPQTADDLWIAIEASNTIDASDIDRAKETAEILSVVYQAAAEPVAAGYEVSKKVRGYAKQNGVRIILI